MEKLSFSGVLKTATWNETSVLLNIHKVQYRLFGVLQLRSTGDARLGINRHDKAWNLGLRGQKGVLQNVRHTNLES